MIVLKHLNTRDKIKDWINNIQKSISEGCNSCFRPSNLTQIGFKSLIFCTRMTLKFDEWRQKTIGNLNLSYVAQSFVHQSEAIGEFKLELQSLNAQFGSRSAIFLSIVTLTFDRDLLRQFLKTIWQDITLPSIAGYSLIGTWVNIS